jgi:periplasmic protein CpxP/Spy
MASTGSAIDQRFPREDLTEAQQAEIRKIMETDQSQQNQQPLETRKQINAGLTEVQKATREDKMQARMERDLDRMDDRLDLADDQVIQIKALFDELQTNPNLTRTQLRERIAAVLTDAQRANT